MEHMLANNDYFIARYREVSKGKIKNVDKL